MLNIQPRCLWIDCLVERMQQLIDDGSFKFDISLGNLCDLVNVVLLEIFFASKHAHNSFESFPYYYIRYWNHVFCNEVGYFVGFFLVLLF